MSGLLLVALLIIIPLVGAFIGLVLSQLEDAIAAEGRTRDWILFIIIFIPQAIISFILLKYLHADYTYGIFWLPGLELGIRLSETSIIFACIISNFSALLALYSISFMNYDRYRSQYWFFYQITLAATMMGVFSNNIFWLFAGFEIASLCAFFLISHYHRKSGDEGEKAGNAAIKYLIISIIGDFFLLIGFGFIMVSFDTSIISELIAKWIFPPVKIIGGSSSSTRLLIKVFIVIGSLIKSAQIPILIWPLSGKQNDHDLSKSPLSVSAFLLSVTIGNFGLYILGLLYPIFSRGGYEYGTNIGIFSQTPFIIIGWFSVISLIVIIGMIFTSDNINRVIIGASLAQISFSLIGFSSGNKLGFSSAIIHLLLSIPSSIALYIVFGMIIESLRIRSISRVSGLKGEYPTLYYIGFIAILALSGIFPSSIYFSKDMILKSLIISSIPSSIAILILTIICSILLIIAITKSFMKLFHGEVNDEYSMRSLKKQSLVSGSISLIWAIFAGIFILLIGYPTPSFISGLLDTPYFVSYDSPIFSSWIASPLTLILCAGAFIGTYFVYRDGRGKIIDRFRNLSITKFTKRAFENGLYIDKIYDLIIFQPIGFLSKLFAWTRIKAPYASVIGAILALVIMISVMSFMGGN